MQKVGGQGIFETSANYAPNAYKEPTTGPLARLWQGDKGAVHTYILSHKGKSDTREGVNQRIKGKKNLPETDCPVTQARQNSAEGPPQAGECGEAIIGPGKTGCTTDRVMVTSYSGHGVGPNNHYNMDRLVKGVVEAINNKGNVTVEIGMLWVGAPTPANSAPPPPFPRSQGDKNYKVDT